VTAIKKDLTKSEESFSKSVTPPQFNSIGVSIPILSPINFASNFSSKPTNED